MAATIALLAQTLATQNVCPAATPNAPAVLVTSPTRFGSLTPPTAQMPVVMYALSFLTGPALGWFEPGLFDPSPPPWVENWDLFRTKLESNSVPFDPVGEAKAEIKTLVMAVS